MLALVTIPRSETTTTLLRPKALLELRDLRGQRLVVVQLAGEHLDRDRPARLVAQQPVDDLRRAALAVTRVAQLRQRARAPLEIRGGHVVEHQLPILEVAAGEAILDPLLALQQPVHRRVQIVLVGARDPSSSASVDCAKRPRPSRASTPARSPADRSSPAQITLPRRLAVQQPRQLEPARHRQAPRSHARPAASARSRTPHRPGRSARPRSAARISSTASAGRCERFASVSFLTFPPSR